MFGTVYFAIGAHRIRGWFGRRRAAVVAGGVAALLLAGGAFAYMLAGGFGNATYNSPQQIQSPTPIALTVVATAQSGSPLTSVGSTDTQWSFGDHQDFKLQITNPGTSDVTITHETLSWSVGGTDETQTPLGPSFTMVGGGQTLTIPAGGTMTLNGNLTVNFQNLPSVDQTSLAGQSPSFTFSVS